MRTLSRLGADPRILAEPAPRLFVQEWAADKRTLAVQAWTAAANYPAVQEELLEGLGVALEAARGEREGERADGRGDEASPGA